MNPRLERLQLYPFERLARLLEGLRPPAHMSAIALHIGEPKHAPPAVVLEALRAHLDELGSYPATGGMPELRAACAEWLTRRFALPAGAVDPQTMVLPVNGTREALFAIAQAVLDPAEHALVAMPNPFYQIYEGAAVLGGGSPLLLNTTATNRYVPDLDAVPADLWRRCRLLYLCSPGNPTGAVLGVDYLRVAIDLAERYDFLIAADECYTELYADDRAPPPSLLNAALASGRTRFERCVVFHSLSKRSSVPGLRSGFVAGDPQVLRRFLLYRTYHGCAMPIPTQRASAAAWRDDQHVRANRELYRRKFAAVLPLLAPVLDVAMPDGG
ncbi:MAG: succinyldiaminopimelate transaminase, partial [Steroidobacteraceae bacterium]|nr:succinyldiaminopimelate transaminase [Steroidobacteraceae bacterium]MDW8257816.1 succinyldiaminopimelate transaminase [Gammaproteobacteria bacterium]